MIRTRSLVLIVVLAYANPASIYLYKAIYRGWEEAAFALAFSAVFTLLVSVFLIAGIARLSVPTAALSSVLSSFALAILTLIASQLLFTANVFGFSELGAGVLGTYFGLSMITPGFWINLVVIGLVCILVRKRRDEVAQ